MPTTLLRTDSSGCVSSIATCLYAAAWKTTVGWYFSNTSRRIAFRSLTSMSFGSAAVKSRSATSSRSISNSGPSALSTRISRDGRTRAIWRQSSEPIEPPAPVTSTVWPSRYAATSWKSTSTCSRPSTSSHLHGTDLAGEAEVAGDELVEPRQRLDHDAQLLRRLDDPPAHLARDGRHRDQHLVGAMLAQHVRQLVDRAEHADAHDPRVPLARVVVDEPDRRVVEHPRALHLLDDQAARVAGADDDHLLAARDHRQAAGPLDRRAREEARAHDEARA